MVHGSNRLMKHRVRMGGLCFICEKKFPTVYVEEVDAYACEECYENLQTIRLKNALEQGYMKRGDFKE